MSDAFTPGKKPQETQAEYDERTKDMLLAGTSPMREYFNLAWVKGGPDVDMRIVRDALSHGDALIEEDGILIHRRRQGDTIKVSNKDLDSWLAITLATYDVGVMDSIRVAANVQAHLDRHVRPYLKPWDEMFPRSDIA